MEVGLIIIGSTVSMFLAYYLMMERERRMLAKKLIAAVLLQYRHRETGEVVSVLDHEGSNVFVASNTGTKYIHVRDFEKNYKKL